MARTLPEQRRSHEHAAAAHRDMLPLTATLTGAAALATLLWLASGPPRWPDAARDADSLAALLRSGAVRESDLVQIASAVAWLTLGYLTITIVLRAAAVLATVTSNRARWARAALSLTHLITIPAVRRLVDGGIAGSLLVASWTPVAPRGMVVHEAPTSALARPITAAGAETATAPQVEQTRSVRYTVQPGEDLWRIARFMYGDGSRYLEIVEENRRGNMPGADDIDAPHLARAGWVLDLPLPSQRVDADGETVRYHVAPGDHLWGIASRFLGDGFRWPELWEANRGQVMADGRRFTDPNLIHPGWALALPAAVVAPSPVTPTPDAPANAEPASTPHASVPDADLDAPEIAGDGLADELGWEWPSLPRPVLVTAAGFVVLGTVLLLVHRLGREALQPARLLGRRAPAPGDAGRVALITRGLLAALDAAGVPDVRVQRVDEADGALVVRATCAGEAERVAQELDAIGQQLGCAVDVVTSGDGEFELALRDAGTRALALGEQVPARRSLLLPVGSDEEGVIVYVDLAGSGVVSVSGDAAARRRLLRDWLITLATANTPEELALRADRVAATTLGAAAALPHFGGTAGAEDAADLVEELEDLLARRLGGAHDQPAVVAVIDAGDNQPPLPEDLRLHGAEAGVHLITLHVSAPEWAAAHVAVTAAGEDVDAARSSLILTVGAERTRLSPVLVRRDGSRRWLEHAAPVAPFAPEDRDQWTDGRSERDVRSVDRGDEPPGFDWGRALFGPDPAPDAYGMAVSTGADLPTGSDEVGTAGVQATPEQTAHTADKPAATLDEAEPPATTSDRAVGPSDSVTEVVEDLPETDALPDDPGVVPARRTVSTSDPPARQQALFAPSDHDAVHRGASAADPLLTVRCLGGIDLLVDDREVTGWKYEKARELLALLVAHGGAPVARPAAAEALWPDYDWDASVRHLLSNAATTLRSTVREALGRRDLPVVVLNRDRYSLQPGLVHSDLDEFEARLRRAASLPDAEAVDEYERAFHCYRGDFLPYSTFVWAEHYRAEYLRRFVEASRLAGDAALRLGDAQRAVRFYQAGLAREPFDELTVRGLMRALAALGDSTGVRKAYRVLSEALQQEFDARRAAPSAATQALLQELTSGAPVAQ